MSDAIMREQIKLLEAALLNSEHVSFTYLLRGPGMTYEQAAHLATVAHREALKKHAWTAIQRIRAMGK